MLTTGRGGQFEPGADGYLIYRPSGKEPKIVAGSRLGVPLKAKGRNEKRNDERAQAHFLLRNGFKKRSKKAVLQGMNLSH